MKGLKVHHYGLATDNLERSMATMRALGYEIGSITLDPIQKVRVVFVSRDHEAMIELISDTDENGPTRRFLSAVGSGLYHICYEVDNIEEATKKLRAEGFLIRHAPVPAVACGGRKIAWMYNRYIGLIELLEK